jgi:hypothetical protein
VLGARAGGAAGAGSIRVRRLLQEIGVRGDKVALRDLIWGQLHLPSALLTPTQLIISYVGSSWADGN